MKKVNCLFTWRMWEDTMLEERRVRRGSPDCSRIAREGQGASSRGREGRLYTSAGTGVRRRIRRRSRSRIQTRSNEKIRRMGCTHPLFERVHCCTGGCIRKTQVQA